MGKKELHCLSRRFKMRAQTGTRSWLVGVAVLMLLDLGRVTVGAFVVRPAPARPAAFGAANGNANHIRWPGFPASGLQQTPDQSAVRHKRRRLSRAGCAAVRRFGRSNPKSAPDAELARILLCCFGCGYCNIFAFADLSLFRYTALSKDRAGRAVGIINEDLPFFDNTDRGSAQTKRTAQANLAP